MTTFTRRPTQVEAFQYNRQPKAEWPQWLTDYQVMTSMGPQNVGAGPGLLLIPTKAGATINVVVGEWAVLENGVLYAYKADAFEAAFDGDFGTPQAAQAAAETPTGPEEPETPAPVAEPAAAEAPAETAPTTGRGRQKASGTETPAEDAPATDANA